MLRLLQTHPQPQKFTMSTLAELESEFEMLAACCEAAKNDFTIKDDQRIELAQRYRVIHACLFAVRKEAVAGASIRYLMTS